MNLRRRILKAAMVGGAISFVSQVGFYFCNFTGGVWGIFPFAIVPFERLAFWPLAVFSLFFPDPLPSWLIPPIISLIGWLLLATIAASIFHIFTSCRKPKVPD
jgi:hypothetical protein